MDLPHMAFNSHLIVETIIHTEVVISNINQIGDFQVLARIPNILNNSLLQEVVVVISAIYNGPHQELNEVVRKTKITTQANKIPYIHLLRSHIEPHKSQLPMLMKRTILFDPKIFKWRMRRKRRKWLHQGDIRVMIINRRILPSSLLHLNRKYLPQLQLSLHQIYPLG